MDLFKNCLLACDIDGTLQVNGKINERSIDRIKYFVSEGGNFALSTGRTACAVNDVLEKLSEYISPSVVGNGTVIYDFKNDNILFQLALEPDFFDFIKDVYEKFPTVGIEVHCQKTPYLIRLNDEIEAHGKYEHMVYVPITLDELHKYSPNKILFADSDLENLENLFNYAKDKVSNAEFKNTAADLGGRKRHYVEMVPLNVSKSSALRELCKIISVKKGGYFAIGDYYNDLEMIKDSDIGCFTADAPDELKQHADFISGVALEGAVADFIDYLAEKFNANK